jgi:peroxiredoxin
MSESMTALWLPVLLSALQGQVGTRIDDFELRDERGRLHRLRDWREARAVVIAFLGVDCPIAKLYAPRLADLSRTYQAQGVAFVALDANQHDTPADVARYLREQPLPFPMLLDAGNRVADLLAATRTAEVFLLDEQRVVRYHGRMDDQYMPGVHRSEPTRRDLIEALDELLAARPISHPVTAPSGCIIDRLHPVSEGGVNYCRHIAPILQGHCVTCHRPGQIGPFALTSYAQAARWADMIAEVVREQRMPPWHASPEHGRFANDPRLTEGEKQLLAEWAHNGAPEGDPADLPPSVTFPSDWGIGNPDQVVSIPEPITIPAEGVLEYQYVEVDPGFREDRWVQALEVRPSNRKVLHHCNVFLRPPGSQEYGAVGELGSFYLAGTTPGTPPLTLPEGMAKRVPAGWRFVFVLHYTPIGSVQSDQTSIGMKFADPKTVKKEVASNILLDQDLCIPPHTADHRVEQSRRFDRDVLLLAMFPHMHLRGKSFRYEVDYPDGTSEVLLDVPRWDFNWQNRYVLAEPKRLPAGTVLRCVAHFDNSSDNPANPDPSATVRTGSQSWDEMFNGYYEVALADQDLTRPPTLAERLVPVLRLVVVLVLIGAGVLFTARRFASRRAGIKGDRS